MKRLILKKSLVILSFLLLLISQGCIYSDMTHLSDDDLEWMVGFYDDGYIEYSSDTNNIDTVLNGYYSIMNSSFPIYVSDNYYETFSAQASVTLFFNTNQQYHTHCSLYFMRDIENRDTLSMSIASNPYNVNINDDKLTSPEITISLGDFKTKGHYWDNCMIVDLDYIETPFNKHSRVRYLKTIVIQKGHGLVYYKYFDGEEFFFKRIIKRK